MAEMFMIPGKTIIGHARFQVKDEVTGSLNITNLDVYYGNVIHEDNGKISQLPDNVYRKKLNHFLRNEGRMYREPTDDDLEDSYNIAHGKPATHGMDEFGRPGKKKEEKKKEEDTQQLDTNSLKNEESKPVSKSATNMSTNQQPAKPEPPKQTAVQPTPQPAPAPAAVSPVVPKQENIQPVQPNPLENKPAEKEDLAQQEKELERQLKENKRKQAEEKRQQDAEQKRLQKAEARKAKEDARLAGKTERSQLDNSDSGPVAMRHSKALMPVLTVLVALVVISIAGNVYLFKQLHAATAKPDTLDVVQITGDVNAGDVLSEDNITKVSITEDEYSEMSGKSVIKADGTTEDEKPLLWNNREQAVGKYATENLKDGDTLLTSDYSAVTSDSSVISMDLNGQTVKVPVNVTTAGNSDIRLYAIITTTDNDGNSRNAAVDLGEFKLEGRTLSDILNSEGQSKLEEYLGQAKTENSGN